MFVKTVGEMKRRNKTGATVTLLQQLQICIKKETNGKAGRIYLWLNFFTSK